MKTPPPGSLESEALQNVKDLLYAEVIDCTYGVMVRLASQLDALSNATLDPESELVRELQNLTSFGLCNGLHTGEIPLSNRVIRAKNNIFKKLGMEIPDNHKEVNAADFTYRW